MREIFTYGSVGGAPGNRCFYPEPDRVQVRFFRPTSSPEGCQISNTVVLRHPSGEACVRLPKNDTQEEGKWLS